MALQQIIKFLEEGNDVIIHANQSGRCFKANHENIGEDKLTIYFDVSSFPGLLEDGEWEYYIKAEGFKEVKFNELTITNISTYLL